MAIARFPRLPSPPGELKFYETILRATYNRLVRDVGRFAEGRGHFGKGFVYDLYRTKRGKDAQRHFFTLADTLIREKIDPSLYLKVQFKYGQFGGKGYLPPPGWLASPKALEIFRWKRKAEREMFLSESQWKSHLNDSETENPKHMHSAIRDSAESVQELMDGFGLGVLEAVLMRGPALSPWFLAVCPPFHTAFEIARELLDSESLEALLKCMAYLKEDRRAFNEAFLEYSPAMKEAKSRGSGDG
jgi:hypothetical protein